MDVKNQYAVLGLIATGKIQVDAEQGIIYNRKGKPYSGNLITGYLQHCFLMFNGHPPLMVYAHCVVYLSKYGAFNPKMVIDHMDRNRANNSIHNLRCITQSENTKHSPERAHHQEGFRSRRATQQEREEILLLTRQGRSQVSLAAKFGMTRQTIKRIADEEWAKYKQKDKRNWLNFELKKPDPDPVTLLPQPNLEPIKKPKAEVNINAYKW